MGAGKNRGRKAKNKPAVLKSKKPKHGVVKPCVKLKLTGGTVGSYGELLKTRGDGTSDRDHMPSYKALEKRARHLKGDTLTPAEKGRVKRAGLAIVLRKDIHRQGRTFGGKNTDAQSSGDANDLRAAAQRDVVAYKQVTGATSFLPAMQKMVMTNKQYDARLLACLDP
jgi:hypothetical protein